MNKMIIVATVLLSSINVFADEAKPADPAPQTSAARESYAGALLGAAVSTSSGGSSSFFFSGRAGTSLFSDPSGYFSLGLFVGHDSSSTSVGAATISGNFTPILAELLTRKAFGTGLYFGGRIGIGLESASISASGKSYDASATSFVVGPVAGYEIPITPVLNFDLDVAWLSASGATFNFPGLATINTNSSGAFTLQGGLTYHW